MHDWPRPLIIAHRGASAHAPENTLAAFELALAQGTPAIELDVKLSSDGEVIVFHDQSLERTTNGKGQVTQLSLPALRELDAGSYFSDIFRGEKIPTLAEVFELVGSKAIINVELTNYFTPSDGLADKVCEVVKRFGLDKSTLFSSKFAFNLTQTRSLLPEVPRGLLAFPGWVGWWARSFGFAFGDYQSLNMALQDASPQQVARVHKLDRRILVYTVNDPADMQQLIQWGADGFFTDDPKLALEMLEKET